MYEILEHTADVGLRARAATLAELYAEAALGLAAMLVENPADVRPELEVPFRIESAGLDRADLLVEWLRELLYQYETAHLIFVQFELALTDNGLEGKARGERFDPARHRPDFAIKAVTYHRLRLEETEEGWLGEVIFDI